MKLQLYYVTTIVKEYHGYKDVPFDWFYSGNGGEGPTSRFGVPYADLIENYSAEAKDPYAQQAIDERFTANEAYALKVYLDRVHGDTGVTTIKQVSLPMPDNVI